MGTNTLAGTGLGLARSYSGGAGNYAGSQMLIKNGYASGLAVGDPVQLLASPQGYVGIVSGTSPTNILGVFGGVLPYYDTNLQATSHGLNGSYVTTAAPPAGTDIPCIVYTDPNVTFVAQVSGLVWLPSWTGQNITWLASTYGAPNATGRSTLLLDSASIATTNTLPLRIVGPIGVSGGPQDPANTNPWIEVKMNTAFALAPLGV